MRATDVFDASELISELPDSFAYVFPESGERLTGEIRTRAHSGFGGKIAYEEMRATDVFDSSELISELPDSFAYVFPESGERIDKEMKEKMLEQEKICQKYFEQTYNLTINH